MRPQDLPPPPDEWHDISTFPRYLRFHLGRALGWVGLVAVEVGIALLLLGVTAAAGLAIVWGVLLLGRNG